jgi:UDP-3-O-[3-hydroxymyristoyl] N-acetylglucosamine deacetylase/3-hydroxyacyl-[acyl-carrier-protein] dehydratase
VSTIEHTLAALTGLEIDNVTIQLDGPECPIMDGSSIEFVEVLKAAGSVEQNACVIFLKFRSPYSAGGRMWKRRIIR